MGEFEGRTAKTLIGTVVAFAINVNVMAADMDEQTQASFDTVMAFMGAVGTGDMETVTKLMADDMVWQNEGDSQMPWIGPWNGKEEIMQFLGVFSKNIQTTAWENTDAFALGDTVAVFGKMNGITTHSGKEIGDFILHSVPKYVTGRLYFGIGLKTAMP